MSILIVTEIQKGAIREASYELVAFAQKMGGEYASLVIGSGVDALAGDFAGKGGGKTFVADDASLENYNVDGYAAAIQAAIESCGADTILISNTPSGWDVAPRVAAALDAGFVSDVFDFQDGHYVRRVFNGKLDAQVRASGGKTVVSVQPGALAAFEGSSDGSTEALSVDTSGARAQFVEVKVAEIVEGALGERHLQDPVSCPGFLEATAKLLLGRHRQAAVLGQER